VYVGSSTIPQATSSVGNPYLYAGKWLDHETGFLYVRNRYVHTTYGRFLTNDPLGSWADPYSLGNGYVPAGNAPTVLSDPYGLLSVYGPGYTGGGPADAAPPPGFAGAMAGARAGGGGGCLHDGMVVDDAFLAPAWQMGDPPSGRPPAAVLAWEGRPYPYTSPMPSPVHIDLSADGYVSIEHQQWVSGGYEPTPVSGDPYWLKDALWAGLNTLGDVFVESSVLSIVFGELSGGATDVAETLHSGQYWWLLADGLGMLPFLPGSSFWKRLCEGCRHTPDQRALKELVDEVSNRGTKPLSRADAETVLDWASEIDYPGWRAGAGDVSSPSNWRANPVPHIHLPGAGRGGHVPVEPGVRPR
jgi:RHS repeat-associated protein